ncbi:uncharacterized protein LOC109857289 [Pseudomyrmex gracilis]|uniref:uncharacterized protein LOC109857289 n=1 Tax=Pseudomyrmex gracilis TaxID=219809 RepID=UPI0009953EF8|nr:uncharacterized protein LOC109857289 [Pseudomyrmex gracilis]
MSDLEETNRCVADTQETYYDDTDKNSIEKGLTSETQKETNITESQDFHLIVSEEEESMKNKMTLVENKEDNSQKKSIDQISLQQTSHASESLTDQNVITASEDKDKEVTEKNLSSITHGSEKNENESLHLSDDDEVIQGTPPLIYSPSRKSIGGNIDVTSLKRKAEFFDEPPGKIQKTSTEDTITKAKRDFEEENSSGESNDSYQDLFKNSDKNIIIEETQGTQDLNNQEVIQDSLSKDIIETKNDDKIQEQLNQSQNEEKNMKEDENLNVSMKVNDNSMNDSINVNVNSANESDLHIEDNSKPIETIKDKSENESLDETNKFVQIKDDTEANKAEQDPGELVTKTANNSNKSSSFQTKTSSEIQTTSNSRTSVELIYDDANVSKTEMTEIVLDSSSEIICDHKNSKEKPEIVEIVDDSREKIILDSLGESMELHTSTRAIDKSLSHESKTCSDLSHKESTKESSLDSRITQSHQKLINGSSESKHSDTDHTLSVESDTFNDIDLLKGNVQNIRNKGNSFMSKDLDNIEVISISDNEMSNTEEKNKSDLHNSALTKAVQVEREIGMCVRLKCILHVDENTKEFLSKEVTMVNCEPATIESVSITKQKNEDSQGSLADISDNKESSPGSVTSNLQPYVLNPSRLSIMSSISSSSSASSAASLALKLNSKSGTHFSMPLVPTKHAKKSTEDVMTVGEKQIDEAYERVTQEWKNHRLLTMVILNRLNTEINNSVTATTGTVQDSYVNVSNDRLYDHLQKSNMHSSTPEVTTKDEQLVSTPKSMKKGRSLKRARSKPTKPSATQTNGVHKKEVLSTWKDSSLQDHDGARLDKKSKIEDTENKLLISKINVLANSSPSDVLDDDLIGKDVFAKWSDNNYYPGTVVDRLKTKYKVNFYDGKSKMLIAEFVIPIPKMLREGLSVYASKSDDDDYSCGIIVDAQASKSGNSVHDIYYTVETDNKERLRVQVRNIFLSPDQAQLLKEDMEDKNSLPSTPKAFNQVTLDNLVEGKRRSKRIGNGTPILSTPKSRSNVGDESASKVKAEPSVSGMSGKQKKGKIAWLDSEVMSSDSNIEVKDESAMQMDYEYILRGVQKEIHSTPCDQLYTKGPLNRIKGKPRSKKKMEDEHIIATLGPIPLAKSNIFKDMSFIFTCASVESLDRFIDIKAQAYNTETETNESEIETEYEGDWMDRPFARDRLREQILAGGGKIYEDFDQIPKNEYKNTKLITNVPNTTAKNIWCLSAGIPAYSHRWIIRCCLEGKTVNAAEEALPIGWSLQKKNYVEAFQAREKKPLSNTFVIIPRLDDTWFVTFWQQVCENAGAVVLIVDDSEAMETGVSNVVIVSNPKCPLWAVDSANKLQIPILSTTWVVQCLIEGKICLYDQHPRYKYNYMPN